MSISDKLARLAEIKADIKEALQDKGLDVDNDTPFAEYADFIGDIEVGGGGGDESVQKDLISRTVTDNVKGHNNNPVGFFGTPTVDNNLVASNFLGLNSIFIPSAFSPTASDTWELKLKIKTGEVSDNQCIFQSCIGLEGGNNRFGIFIGITTQKFEFAVSINGTSWLFDKSSVTPSSNTDYYLKAKFDGAAYTLSYSTDDSTYTTAITHSSTSGISITLNYVNFGVSFGQSGVQSAFKGSIYLNETIGKINDNTVLSINSVSSNVNL